MEGKSPGIPNVTARHESSVHVTTPPLPVVQCHRHSEQEGKKNTSLKVDGTVVDHPPAIADGIAHIFKQVSNTAS